MLHGTFEASVDGLHEPFVHSLPKKEKKNTKKGHQDGSGGKRHLPLGLMI